MGKEIFIAILVGITLGAIVTYGVYTANQAISEQSTTQPQTTTIPTPTPEPQQLLQVSVREPQNHNVYTQSEITISGISSPGTVVTIITPQAEYFLPTDISGEFSQDINLIKGANTIQINASDGNQVSPTKTLNLVYSTEITQDLISDTEEDE